MLGIAPANAVFAADLSDSIVLHLTENHTDNQVVINVNLITNTGVSAIGLELTYDTDVFTVDGYERGTALNNFTLTPPKDLTQQIRFLWDNDETENDSSVGNLLTVRFTLKSDCNGGEYNVSFKPFNIGYYDKNHNPTLKSAIIDKAVISVTGNKITEIEIKDAETFDSTDVGLIVGSVIFAVAAVSTAVVVLIVKIRKGNRRRKSWLKL